MTSRVGVGERENFDSFKKDAGETSNSSMAVTHLLQAGNTAQCLTDNTVLREKLPTAYIL